MGNIGYFSLGANQFSAAGSPRETLSQAIAELSNGAECASESLRLCAVSRFFATPAFPAGSGPDYVNAAISVRTTLPPDVLLARLHAIEAKFGRVRTGRWQARTLDIDLIGLDAHIAPDVATLQRWMALPLAEQTRLTPDRLILPHPRLQDRAFVLIPLADIAPHWRHPLTGLSVAQMLAALPMGMKAEVRPL